MEGGEEFYSPQSPPEGSARFGSRIYETAVAVAAGPSYSVLYPVVELLHGVDVESSILSLLHNAQTVIEISQYCFGHRGIVAALTRFLRHRGSEHSEQQGRVRMILDAQQMSNPSTTYQPDAVEELLSWGAEVRSYRPSTGCLLYTSPSPRDGLLSRMPSSA